MKNTKDYIALIIAILGLIIAFLNWIFPFAPVQESPLSKKEASPSLSPMGVSTTAINTTDIFFPTERSSPSETATIISIDTAVPTYTFLPIDTPLLITEIPEPEVIHLQNPTITMAIQGGTLFCKKAIICGPRFQEGDTFHVQYSIVQGNPSNTEFDILGFHSYKHVVEAQGYFDGTIPIDNWNAGPLTIWMINCNPEPILVEFSLSGGEWNRCE